MKSVLIIISSAFLMAACSPSDPNPKIAEDQREVMDKANQVEDVLQQSAEHTDQQVDEQTQ